MLAMLFARRLFTGALGALALIVFNLFIRSVIPATSRLNVIKYANLISLLRTNELLGGYRNLYWFDPVSYTHLDVYKRQGGSGTVCKVPTSENPSVLRNGRRTTGVSGMEKKKQELIF